MTDVTAQMTEKAARMAEDLLFPRRCPVCDRPVRPFGALICPSCDGMLQRIEAPFCRRCGKPLRGRDDRLCRDCSRYMHVFDRGCAALTYQSVSGAIFRFKYGGRREYASFFGKCMTEVLMRRRIPKPDLLVPVPVSAKKMRKRGYNQAMLLAQEVSGRTGIPVRGDVLLRVEDTRPMKNMSFAERQNNLKKAFQAYGNDVKCNSILLVDDVYTTGATVDACARALYAQGARNVCFAALAAGEDIRGV